MITISLCMIVKNEEDVLARCLNSAVGLVDEIIVVDTGSTDRTVGIAREYTDQVYAFTWVDDFAAARNYAFSLATKEYCMWLDADDVFDVSEQEKFFAFKERMDRSVDIVMMKYQTAFDEKDRPTFQYDRERIVRNDGTYLWEGAVHEVIVPRGKIISADVAIRHRKTGEGDPDRNLNIYRKIIDKGQGLSPRHRYYYARELYYHAEYEAAEVQFEEFLALAEGWVEDKICACLLLGECRMKRGNSKDALQALLQSFYYDTPRAELCCKIGEWFFEKSYYEIAIYWYEQALADNKGQYSGAFMQKDSYDYIPFLQLCVCYDRLGQLEKAREYNELAGKCKPDSTAYQSNKMYFDSRL